MGKNTHITRKFGIFFIWKSLSIEIICLSTANPEVRSEWTQTNSARRQSLQRGEPPQRAASPLRLNSNPQLVKNLRNCVLREFPWMKNRKVLQMACLPNVTFMQEFHSILSHF